MAFQVSPGVLVTEKDLTNIVPAVSTTSGGIVITAEKGPVDEITTITSENELVEIFGTKVKLKPAQIGGSIEIIYFSDDDLERIIDLLQSI